MEPLAIITICYNDRAGLERTFASVHEQTTGQFDHIVVDGGSTDGSVELVQANTHRIRQWVSEPDGGIYDALNKGWRMTDAPFVLFMNAGDTFTAPDVVERVLPMLGGEVDVVYGDAQLADERGVYGVKPHPRRLTSAWLMKEVVAHQSQFIRRTLLERTGGYDIRYQVVADYAFLARAFWKEHAGFRHSGLAVCVYDTRGFSARSDRKKQLMDERKAIQQRYAPWYWYAVYHGYAALNRLVGR